MTVVANDGSVVVTHLAAGNELSHRTGDLISDGADGYWRVEWASVDAWCLAVWEVAAPELRLTWWTQPSSQPDAVAPGLDSTP